MPLDHMVSILNQVKGTSEYDTIAVTSHFHAQKAMRLYFDNKKM